MVDGQAPAASAPTKAPVQLTAFIYHGPISGATLRYRDENDQFVKLEVLFTEGKTVQLPADNPYVQRLVAQKHLVSVPAAEAPAAPAVSAAAEKSMRTTGTMPAAKKPAQAKE